MIETEREIGAETPSRLPDGWRWVKLGDLCSFIRGVSFDKGEESRHPRPGYVPILRAGNISASLDTANDLLWVPDTRVSDEQKLVVGDTVICMSSGSASVVGKSALLEVPFDGSVGAFCGILRTRNPNLASYVAHWMRSPGFEEWRDFQARGANIQNLRFSQLETLAIPLPPSTEARRIAAILREQMAAVDRARAAAEAQLAAAKALPAAYLRAVFESDEAREWPTVKLGDVCTFSGGTQPPKSTFRDEPAPGYVRLIQIQDYRADKYKVYIREEDSDRRCTVDDIMIARYGGHGDTTSLFRILRGLTGAYNVALIKVIITAPQRVDREYLYWALQRREMREEIVAKSARAIQSGFTQDDLHVLEIPLPRLGEQRQIAANLQGHHASTQRARKVLEEQLEVINQLPAALLRRAFNGEL